MKGGTFNVIAIVLLALCATITTPLDRTRLQNGPHTKGQPSTGGNQYRDAGESTASSQEPDPASLKASQDYNERNIRVQERLAELTYWLVVIGGGIGALQIALMFWTGIVSNKAANAARDSANAEREALELAHRAWVFHETFESGWLVNEAGHRVGRVIVPVFKNSGTVPAVNLRSDVIPLLHVAEEGQGTFPPAGYIPHPKPATPWDSLPEHVTTLGPGHIFRADPIKLTFAGCEALEKGTKALILHVNLEYAARPSDPDRRHSTYCCRVIVTADYTSEEKPFTFQTGPADHSSAN